MAKKALLIGINQYRMPGADLRGCVNDVLNMKATLTELYGFSSRNIAQLIDARATQKYIEAGVKALIAGAHAGDVLLLHYSGHGANVPDDNGDEADGRDEILCPTDLDWYKPLRDDWLRKVFDGLKPGVSLTVIMDCCHSGTNTRAVAPPDAPVIPRFLPCPLDLIATESGRTLRGRRKAGLHKSSLSARRKKDVVVANIPELLITGCRDTQTSADAHIGGSYNGALTYHLASVLRNSGGAISYRDVHTLTTKGLARARFDQVPQLEGRKNAFDRPFLSPMA
jgi:metacaspase-1